MTNLIILRKKLELEQFNYVVVFTLITSFALALKTETVVLCGCDQRHSGEVPPSRRVIGGNISTQPAAVRLTVPAIGRPRRGASRVVSIDFNRSCHSINRVLLPPGGARAMELGPMGGVVSAGPHHPAW